MEHADFNSLFYRLRHESPSRQMQRDVAAAIDSCLDQLKDTLANWEKVHLAEALSALSMNLRSRPIPSDLWLTYALVSAQKALVPSSERNDHYTPKDEGLTRLTYQQLKDYLEQMRLEIPLSD